MCYWLHSELVILGWEMGRPWLYQHHDVHNLPYQCLLLHLPDTNTPAFARSSGLRSHCRLLPEEKMVRLSTEFVDRFTCRIHDIIIRRVWRDFLLPLPLRLLSCPAYLVWIPGLNTDFFLGFSFVFFYWTVGIFTPVWSHEGVLFLKQLNSVL